MILLNLLWSFFKIGLFSFGGGYAMIPLIQQEIEANNWINPQEFADIVAISEMTPGPLAVNAATYVGVKTAGFWGAFFATLGVSLPSFTLVILVAHFFIKFKENKSIEAILKGIRPATIGLIGSAVIFFSEMSIFTGEIPFRKIRYFLMGQDINIYEGFGLDYGAFLIFGIILIAIKKFKLNPITAIICSALMGMVLIR